MAQWVNQWVSDSVSEWVTRSPIELFWTAKNFSSSVFNQLGACPSFLEFFLALKTNPRDLWPLRHLISVMRRHDLTKKVLPTYIHTHPPTYLPTYLPDHSLSHFWFSCVILNCAMCAHNCDTIQSCRLVTFETLIAILTIENLNSWQSLLPDN